MFGASRGLLDNWCDPGELYFKSLAGLRLTDLQQSFVAQVCSSMHRDFLSAKQLLLCQLN